MYYNVVGKNFKKIKFVIVLSEGGGGWRPPGDGGWSSPGNDGWNWSLTNSRYVQGFAKHSSFSRKPGPL
jgi:hypothetical protein